MAYYPHLFIIPVSFPPVKVKSRRKNKKTWRYNIKVWAKVVRCTIVKTEYKTIDEYIRSFPPDIRIILEKIRQTIRKKEKKP
jgi:hypothetical protein